jgi:hypothetical protein
MNQTKYLLVGTLVSGIMASVGYGQTFTFSTIAGGGMGTNDGVGTAAQFNSPVRAVVDGLGDVFVADGNNNLIREIIPSGTNWIVTTIAGGARGFADGTNGDAEFFGPTGIVLDNTSNLYVADQFNQAIRKITPSGTNWIVTTIAGQPGLTNLQNGMGTNAHFDNPVGLAIDSAGDLFVADELHNAIRELAPAGGGQWNVSTIAGGTQGSSNAIGTAAQFYYPSGVAVDSSNTIFVADQLNNLIRQITPQGPNWVVTTIAGQLIAGSSNGVGASALFDVPVDIALGTNGNLFVADLFNNSIRELTPSGSNWVVSTIGGGDGTRGFVNGVGTNAQFLFPSGVVSDVWGDIYVADTGNNDIRQGLSSSNILPLGNLTVNITPSAAVTAGAQWQLNGGAWQASGDTLTGISPGDYTLGFSNVTGFTTPAWQPITITAHQTTTTSGNYPAAIPNAGSVEALIFPDDVIDAGAEWQVDDGPLQTNGAVVADLSLGTHTVTFTVVSNWITPLSQTITVSYEETSLAVGDYSFSTGPNYTVTVNAATGGSASGGGVFANGSTVLVTATPTNGFEFIGWAGDAAGTNNPLPVIVNTNLAVTAYFAPIGSMTVIVLTNGDGTITPDLNGKTLIAGHKYTLRAAAKPNNVFSNWVGSLTTNKPALTFTMESSMVLQANIVPNPFLPLRGTYNGLFSGSNGVSEQTAGMLRGLVIRSPGTYSGALLINGASHPISGTFDLGGQATNKIVRSASQGGTLVVQLTVDNTNGTAPEITGMVEGTNNGVAWAAGLLADRATNVLPSAAYTLLIAPDLTQNPPTSSPGGDSYAAITNHDGNVHISGFLADGTSISEFVPASASSYVPLYANLYNGEGVIMGWISLNPTNNSEETVTWIHPPRPTGLYQVGFTNFLTSSQIQFSPWTNPPGNVVTLTNLALLSNIYASGPATTISISGTKITGSGITGTFSPSTGLFKVVIGGGTANRIAGYGAVALDVPTGGGYYLTKTNAQGVVLAP